MSLSDEFDQPAVTRKKTHRGRRSKGKGPKPEQRDHMGEANSHIQNAHKDPTAKGTSAHLFKALSSLKKASKEGC